MISTSSRIPAYANMGETATPPLPMRRRNESISVSFQKVSGLLDDGILENREQAGIMKDLIISGNGEIIEMLQKYNQNGDHLPIKALIRNGVFNRKSSLDLLGDDNLSFDFAELTFPKSSRVDYANHVDDFEVIVNSGLDDMLRVRNSSKGEEEEGDDDDDEQRKVLELRTPPFRSVGSFGSKHNLLNHFQQQRMRSGSLSSTSFFQHLSSSKDQDSLLMSMLDDDHEFYGGDDEERSNAVEFFGEDEEDDDEEEEEDVVTVKPGNEEAFALPPPLHALPSSTVSKRRFPAAAVSKPMAIPKPNKNSATAPVKKRSAPVVYNSPDDSTSPSPHYYHSTTATYPIPLLSEEDIAYKRALGIPMTGAYSPESRANRVDRFVSKRDQRVWKKKVKYDVRKNFADSRLRVKGRFVKKEDEEMLREFMVIV